MSSGYLTPIRAILDSANLTFESGKLDVIQQLDELIIRAVENDRKILSNVSNSETDVLLDYGRQLASGLKNWSGEYSENFNDRLYSKIVSDLVDCISRQSSPSEILMEMAVTLHNRFKTEGCFVTAKILWNLKQTAQDAGIRTDDQSQ